MVELRIVRPYIPGAVAGAKREADSDEEDVNKRSKIDSPIQRPVTIIILAYGEDHSFEVDVDLLKANSAEFSKKLDTDYEDEELKPLVLKHVSVEVFTAFAQWLREKRMPTDGVVVDEMEEVRAELAEFRDEKGRPRGPSTESEYERWNSRLDRECRVYCRLVDLFIFAARFQCLGFRRAATLQLQRCIYEWGEVPCSKVVSRTLESLQLDAPLCRYLVACYGWLAEYLWISEARLAKYPSNFLAAVLIIGFNRLQHDIDPELINHWCDFHEHEDDADREDCEKRRSNDPDDKHRDNRELTGLWLTANYACH